MSQCQAAVGFWPTGTPKTCGKPAKLYRNPDPEGWPPHFKLCDEHKHAASPEREKEAS